jgi:hypothetical protein
MRIEDIIRKNIKIVISEQYEDEADFKPLSKKVKIEIDDAKLLAFCAWKFAQENKNDGDFYGKIKNIIVKYALHMDKKVLADKLNALTMKKADVGHIDNPPYPLNMNEQQDMDIALQHYYKSGYIMMDRADADLLAELAREWTNSYDKRHAFKVDAVIQKYTLTPELDEFGNPEDEPNKEDEGSIMNSLNEKEDPCWDSHEMVGKKKKNGKTVPNCVPKK